MRSGWDWIFFGPCRMTWTRWPKLATAGLAGTPRLSTDQIQRVEIGGVGGRLVHPQPGLGARGGSRLGGSSVAGRCDRRLAIEPAVPPD